MATERRIIIEKQNWVPFNYDDGTGLALALIILAALAVGAYALFFRPDHRTVMTPISDSTSTASAPATTPAQNPAPANTGTSTQ